MNFYVFKTWLQARMGADEQGATMVEYALVVALIAVALVLVFKNVGTEADAKMDKVEDCLKTGTC